MLPKSRNQTILLTGVDKLMQIIQTEEITTTNAVSKSLELPENLIKKWALALESKMLIRIEIGLEKCYMLSNEFYLYKYQEFGFLGVNLRSLMNKTRESKKKYTLWGNKKNGYERMDAEKRKT